MNGLIGYTGFVGGNLASQHDFDKKYNSTNIVEIENEKFDLVVCAGARAEKWRINQEPEKDLAEIQSLIDHLKTIKTKKFVLISTTDVYKTPIGVDEDSIPETDGLHAYGRNRLYLEEFCRENFDTLTIRLPGLFGHGLKKNVIYDLMHNNNTERIHHAGSFQYYNLEHIWGDINVALENKLKLVNFATEPILTSEIAHSAFNIEFDNEPNGISPGSYDMRTKHAEIFGGHNGYMYSRQKELSDIKRFVKQTSKL